MKKITHMEAICMLHWIKCKMFCVHWTNFSYSHYRLRCSPNVTSCQSIRYDWSWLIRLLLNTRKPRNHLHCNRLKKDKVECDLGFGTAIHEFFEASRHPQILKSAFSESPLIFFQSLGAKFWFTVIFELLF